MTRSRYYTKEPEYPFGWGLSYDDWVVERWAPSPPPLAWSTSTLDDQLGNTDAVVANVSLRVKNAGTHGGGLTVLAMWRPVGHSAPLRQKLFAFGGVRLGPGEETAEPLTFALRAKHLSIADESGDKMLSPGRYEVFIKAAAGADSLATPLLIQGPQRLIERFTK